MHEGVSSEIIEEFAAERDEEGRILPDKRLQFVQGGIDKDKRL